MQDNLYNIAFERAVLSSILFEPKQFETLGQAIYPEDFYLPAHQIIFTAMINLTKRNMPIDEEFIKKELLKENAFDEQVMLEILSANPISNINAYIDEIKEKANLRSLLNLTNLIKKNILEDGSTFEETLAAIELQLQSYQDKSGIGTPITMAQAISDYEKMTEPPKLETGIPKLDDMLCGGIEPAQLVHVGGEKNVGKTTLLKQILYNTSAGFDSLFFSFEMPAWKMAKYTKKMTGAANLNRYRIIDTQMMKSRDVMDVARMIRAMHRKHRIRFVLIDSKMKLTHKTFKGNSDSDRKGDIDAILSAVVQETGVDIMMIVQLSKEDIRNNSMSSYGSGLSDYEADMQIMMYHTKENDGSIEVKVTKNRQEVQYEPVKLWLDKEELKFKDTRVVETLYTVLPQYGKGNNNNDDKVEVVVI